MHIFSHIKNSKKLIVTFMSLFVVTMQQVEAKLKDKSHRECFQHNIQLQLSDANGFPVPGTQFWVTLDIIKQGPLVTINIPLINFQTGECSSTDPFCPSYIPGGFLLAFFLIM